MTEKGLSSYSAIEVDCGDIRLQVTQSVGPRIISLSYQNAANIFAELPGESLEFSDQKKFYFYGGHRLWIAPEKPEFTYSPDDSPITIHQDKHVTELVQNPDKHTGMQKMIRIESTQYPDVLIIDHTIINKGENGRRIAPWAITQLQLGGVAILPIKSKAGQGSPFLPNRGIILWPYTKIQDSRLLFENDYILLDARQVIHEPVKLGLVHGQSWIAYRIRDIVFIKYSKSAGFDCSLDMGAEHQCYCNDKFIELETIGTYQQVPPDSAIHHREVWRLIKDPFKEFSLEEIVDFINDMELQNEFLEL